MAQIGNLGKLIVFEVSSETARTFQRMTQTVSGRWATHNPIGGKPVPEYLGPGQRASSLPISLSVKHGGKPRGTIEKMEKAVEKGEPFPFVLGGQKIGNIQWVIISMSETWDETIKAGRLVSAHVTLTLAEYV